MQRSILKGKRAVVGRAIATLVLAMLSGRAPLIAQSGSRHGWSGLRDAGAGLSG
jgi:hypothetical protein